MLVAWNLGTVLTTLSHTWHRVLGAVGLDISPRLSYAGGLESWYCADYPVTYLASCAGRSRSRHLSKAELCWWLGILVLC